jgi:serine protease Do
MTEPGAGGATPFGQRSSRAALPVGVALAAVVAATPLAPGFGSPPAAQAGSELLRFPDVVDAVKDSVIGVKTSASRHPGAPSNTPMNKSDLRRSGLEVQQAPPFGGFDEDPAHGQERLQILVTQGSGFFISADGYAVTNGHVVGDSDAVQVETDDGKTYSAKVVGIDPVSDLALLKVDGEGFTPVKIADRSPRVGEWVLAIGNPFGLGGTVTAGIVSAQNRNIAGDPYDDLIQIDAPVNQGNSGGPAFDLDGNVVGVNTMIVSPTGGSIGIAFAVPADTLRSVLTQLKERGVVSRGWIGVQLQPVPAGSGNGGGERPRGVRVADAQADGPAGKAGIARGDVIVSFNGAAIADARELVKRIAGAKPGEQVAIGVRRNGKDETVMVTLGELPIKKSTVGSRLPQPKSPAPSGSGLGLQLAPNARGKGVLVTGIDSRGSAAGYGLAAGDVIMEVGGVAVQGPDDVSIALGKARREGKRFVLMQLNSGETARFVAVPPDPT